MVLPLGATCFVWRWYYRWELWTGIYMMDLWEKILCNTVAFVTFFYFFYSAVCVVR
jgi:hypothetical protein